jgi:hypothetical protein
MSVKQISISLENVPGKFSEVIEYLGENGINVIAISVADTADISAVRFVANDPEKAANVLESHGYKITDVLAVEAPHHPGGLNAVLKPLKEANININYLYTCLARSENAVLIVGVDNDNMEEAVRVLRRNWVRMIDEEIYTIYSQ